MKTKWKIIYCCITPVLLFIFLVQLLNFNTSNTQSQTNSPSEEVTEDDIIIGILTTGKNPNRIMDLSRSWTRFWKPENVLFISDDYSNSTTLEEFRKWPNYIISRDSNGQPCGTKYLGDLKCKLAFLYKLMYHKYSHKKWFIRVVDDTYICRQNLFRLLRELDPSKDNYIGYGLGVSIKTLNNSWLSYDLCHGGSGWVLSKSVLQLLNKNWDIWAYLGNSGHLIHDDIFFGYFMNYIGVGNCTDMRNYFRSAPIPVRAWYKIDIWCSGRFTLCFIHTKWELPMAEYDELIEKQSHVQCSDNIPF
eukprot:TRINITY_DN1783_c0_g3_i1.p1 TRINITY_DN1783_c0_g3~~TRINITY_DN1783_c0_g3_i1.p1  ORF type:complete len:304 (-),score=5.68 TRINITY_DN1783_c0_g3_i1:81-992(-)